MFVMSTIVIHDQWMELRQLRYVVSVAESGVRVLPLSDAPARVEHLVWGQGPASPATAAFLTVLDSHHREARAR
jgi:DNA-binding transcriptional LysR family regulator